MELGITPKGSDLFDNNNSKYFQNNNIIKISIIIFIIILSIISLVFIYFKIFKPNNIRYSNNISIAGISIKNTSKSEVIESLKNKYDKRAQNQFTLTVDNITTIINPQELNLKYDYEKSYEKALKLEKELVNSKKSNENINIPIEFNLNDEILKKYIDNISFKINSKKNYPYILDMEKLEVTILKNQQYSIIEDEKIKDTILNNYINEEFKNNLFLESKKEKYSNINLNSIYNDITKKAKNAYISNNNTIVKEEYGLEFIVPLNTAIMFDKTATSPYILKLKKIKPDILSDSLIKQLEKKNSNQTENIFNRNFSLANLSNESVKHISNIVDTLDNTYLNTDQTFSFNNSINIQKYSNNINLEEVNSALSFVASAIYTSAIYTNQTILERNQHTNAINFFDLGLDANISLNNDLKFKNTHTSAIKLKLNIANNSLNVKLTGNKLEQNISVDISKTEDLKFNTVKIYNSNINGEKVKQKGVNGGTFIVNVTISDNNNNITKKKISENRYYPLSEIIEHNNPNENNNNSTDNFINLS